MANSYQYTQILAYPNVKSQEGGAGGEAPLTGSGERCLGDSVSGPQTAFSFLLLASVGGSYEWMSANSQETSTDQRVTQILAEEPLLIYTSRPSTCTLKLSSCSL